MNKKSVKFLRVSGFINRIMPAHAKGRETRSIVHNTLAMLTYGCEVWGSRENDKQRITAAEMRFMSGSARYTPLDQKSNEDIMNELQVTRAMKKIEDYKKKWRRYSINVET